MSEEYSERSPVAFAPVGLPSERRQRVSTTFIGTMALSQLGVWMSLFVPSQVLLAQQMAIIAPGQKDAALGLVMSVGSAIALLANPVIGALSDRTTSRFGRRHPWNLAGILFGALALFMLGQQPSMCGVIVWWCLVQIGTSAILSALTAAVPDQVPVSRRAVVSAWSGVTLPLGVVLGTWLTTAIASGVRHGYLSIVVCLLLFSLPFVLLTHDQQVRRDAVSAWKWNTFVAGFWISPRQHPDFVWIWAVRFMVELGNAMGTMFLLYFLRDSLHYERLFPGRRDTDGLLLLVLIYTAAVVVSAFTTAVISDRSGRRKLIVSISGIVMAIPMLMLAIWQTWPAAMVSAGALGLGYGAYVAVGQALVSQILPTTGDHGRDLGIINIAVAAPQVLAPVLCVLAVLQLGGYRTLYLFSGTVGLLGGLLVQKIRSVS